MLKALFLILSSLIFLLSNQALGVEKYRSYIGLNIGGSMPRKKINSMDYQKKNNTAFLYGSSFGYKFNQYFRSDFMVNHRNYQYSSSESKQVNSATTFIINGYYDLLKTGNFTPYVFVGIGFSLNNSGTFYELDEDSIVETKSKLTKSKIWQSGVGFQYNLTKSIDLDCGYRYINLGKFSTHSRNQNFFTSEEIKGSLRSYEMILSIIYKF